MKGLWQKSAQYWRTIWPLVKGLQTGLLLATGLAGYMTARCPITHWTTLLGLTVSLFLAISGSTVLNMWFDRDIDARMQRTCKRPIPSGKISPTAALRIGLIFSVLGVGWAALLSPLFGLVVFTGLFFDVVVYTIWLKRHTPWSIIWGGISGGMPVLAGRALGTGSIDSIGLLLALGVLFWIPTHIMTFSLRYDEDYRRAGVPTFPVVYGEQTTRLTIAISSVLASLMMILAAIGIGTSWGYLRLLGVLSAALFLMALATLLKPSDKLNFGLFKLASIYMFGSMLLLAI